MKYNRISTKFWTDEKVLQWDNETRILALYLLTCPHKTTEGLFRLPKQYICADLAWSLEGLAKPFNKLLEDGFIKYDDRVNVILLCNALKYQSPDNPNQEKAAISLLKELPKTDLLYQFIRQAERFSERFYQRLVEQFGKPLALSLTPTLTLNKDNNIRPDSENDLPDTEKKTELPDEKKSDSSSQIKSSSEKKPSQSQLSDSIQQGEEKKNSKKQIDSPEKVNTTGGKKSTAENSDKNTAVSKTEKSNLEKNDKSEDKSKNKPEDTNNQNPNIKQSPTVEFDCNSRPYQTCCFLIDRIIDNNSRARVPNKDPTDKLMQKWCKELDRLHRLGPLGAKKEKKKGYSWQEICELINWSQQHHFWKSNILSAATLRKQVIKLENQLKQSPANKGNQRMELLKEVYLDAQEDDEKGGFDPL